MRCLSNEKVNSADYIKIEVVLQLRNHAHDMSQALKMIFLILGVLLYVQSGFSDEALGESELAKILVRYQNMKSMQALFQQKKFIQGLKNPLISEGRLAVSGQQKVIWEITKPARVKVTMEGSQISIESGDQANPTRESFKNLKGMTSWLLLDAKQLLKDFEVQRITSVESTSAGRTSAGRTGNSSFRMVPRAKGSEFRSLEMNFAGTGLVDTVTINENSGDHLQIQLSAVQMTEK